MLETNVDAQIEDKGQSFRLKQAYPVEDRVQLKEYLLKKGRYGILGDEDFEMCYQGIQNDVEKLVAEGWARVVETQTGSRKTENNLVKIYFPRDISKKDNDQVEWDDLELP